MCSFLNQSIHSLSSDKLQYRYRHSIFTDNRFYPSIFRIEACFSLEYDFCRNHLRTSVPFKGNESGFFPTRCSHRITMRRVPDENSLPPYHIRLCLNDSYALTMAPIRILRNWVVISFDGRSRQSSNHWRRHSNIIHFLGLVTALPNTFYTFFSHYLFDRFAVGSILGASFTILVVRSIATRSTPHTYLLLCCIMFLPAGLYLGLGPLRAGQALIFSLLLLVSFAAVSHDLLNLLDFFRANPTNDQRNFSRSRTIMLLLTSLLFVLLLSVPYYELRSSRSMQISLSGNGRIGYQYGNYTTPHTTGYIRPDIQRWIVWMRQNIPESVSVYFSDEYFLLSSNLVLSPNQRRGLLFSNLKLNTYRAKNELVQTIRNHNAVDAPSLLFLRAKPKYKSCWKISSPLRRSRGNCSLIVTFLEDTIRARDSSLDSIVVTSIFSKHARLLLKSSNATRLAVFGQEPTPTMEVYALKNSVISSEWKPHAMREVSYFLAELKKRNPKQYYMITNEILINTIGLERSRVDALLVGNWPIFDPRKDISEKMITIFRADMKRLTDSGR